MLAEFVAKFPPTVDGARGICQILVRPRQVYVDRESNARRASIGIVLESPEGIKLERSLRLGFQASNNKVEYEALLAGLQAAKTLGATEVEVSSNSQLVVNQVEGSFKARIHRWWST